MERRLKHWGWGYEDEQLAPEARREAARFSAPGWALVPPSPSRRRRCRHWPRRAVGRDHQPWYDQQRPDVFAAALSAAKAAVDPGWALNPGVLIDQPAAPPGGLPG